MIKKINCYFIAESIITIFALLSAIGALIYRIYALNKIGVIISVLLAILVFIIIQRFRPKNKERVIEKTEEKTKNKIIYFLLATIYSLLLALCFYILFANQTDRAIISPWQVVPSYFFVIYALATAVLIILNNQTNKYLNNLKIILISVHYFLSFSIALIVYKIGFGFDPFIHEATLNLIDKTGSVDPKPFYYLGQYSLIIILHKITNIPLSFLNKFLVAILASVYLPIFLWQVLKKWFTNKIASNILLLSILIFPFSFFIITTPQNLAYLFLLLTIFLGLTCKNNYNLVIIYLLSLATLSIHPIAGIPAILFSLFLTVYYSDKKSLKKYLYILIFILSAISLPLAFKALSGNSSVSISQESVFSWPKLIVPNQENFIINFIYLYGFNLKIILGLIILAGLIIAYRHKEECKILFIYLMMSASLGVSYFLTKKLPFLFLIDYERNSYTERILLILTLFLTPFIIIAIYSFLNALLNRKKPIKITLLCFIIILITTSLYLSYPRYDRYFNSRGFSTGKNEIAAIHWINNNTNKDYIVLANQQVSAAALHELGFKKYYKNEIFYYPVPTGGPLYQYYLDMVYKKPSRETMLAAMNLTEVNEGYFVLNKYWEDFDKILAEAKLEANSFEIIEEEEIYIFKYLK